MSTVPRELRKRTGLSMWPERGSDASSLIEGEWLASNGACVELEWLRNDGYWAIRQLDTSGQRVTVELATNAEYAWTLAVRWAAGISATLVPADL